MEFSQIALLLQIADVKEFLKKGTDERYGELHKGLILSETMAQMEENELIKYKS